MALLNLARMTTATTGTGTITLGSAVSGFLSFADAGAVNGTTYRYAIKDGSNSEIGSGVYTSSGTTLTRVVENSTNAGSAISLSGSAEVFITPSKLDFATILAATTLSGGTMRETLTANRTYYVRTDGNDSNTGLVDSAGGAFLTVQKALNTVAAIDLSAYAATIDLGNGTYTENLVPKSYIGAGPVTLTGDTTTPANVVLAGGASILWDQNGVLGKYKAEGVTATGSSFSFICRGGSILDLGANTYAGTGLHMSSRGGSYISVSANYNVTGSASVHWDVKGCGYLECTGKTITITGTPAFSTAWAKATAGFIECDGNTFSGSATGPRIVVDGNGAVKSGGATLPGDAAGTETADDEFS